MLRFMLDTNIAIYAMKQKTPTIHAKFNQYASRLCVSSITVGELIYGANCSDSPIKSMKTLEDFLSRLQILSYDEQAGIHYGEIKAELRKQGRLIGENDMHIAGHARSLGLIVVTNNTKEFERVTALQLDNWI